MSAPVKLGVIGHPIGHSKSPLIHNHWIEQYGLSGSYEAIDIPPADLATELPRLVEQGYTGFNLTIPHKELALNLCDEIDNMARAIGAVNTIAVRGGRVIGINTDAFGFIENIKQNAPDFDFTRGKAVVLGAGGAAKAAIYGLLQRGADDIVVLNRTKEKAEALTKMNPARITALDWGRRNDALAEANLLVNTTSLGMAGQPVLDINLFALPQTALVNDIVYSPLMTLLLEDAQARGNPVVTGIGMLLHQARPAFQKWFGILPDVDEALIQKVLA